VREASTWIGRAWVVCGCLCSLTVLSCPFFHCAQPRSLMQFIGEVDVRQDRVVLAARVARCVDGLDMDLYQQAVALRRDFERQNDASMMT